MNGKKTFLIGVLFLLFASTGCRDRNFEDARTLYKSSVTVQFIPQETNKHKKLCITGINNTEFEGSPERKIFDLPLNEEDDATTFVIQSTSSLNTIVIKYQRILSLISHKRGAQQEFVLKEVQDTFAGKAQILHHHLRKSNDIGPDVQIYF